MVVGAWRDGGGAITQLFVLTINSVNESATGFTWAQQPIGANQWRNGADGIVTANVNENNAVGMAVGQFAATDGDQGSSPIVWVARMGPISASTPTGLCI